MSRSIVFVGPSLPALHHVRASGIEVEAPAAQGDIARAVADGARRILLVDGVFGWEPAVWHKEILWALEQGVRVLGASSMGALRAAELHRFGMAGIGKVFESYRDGILDADDEVALLHGPAETGWLALSEPLVSIRSTLDRAVGAALLAPDEAHSALELTRARFYPERTRARLRADLAEVTGSPARATAIACWWRAHWVDIKRRDAALAWRALRRPETGPYPPPFFRFCRTEPWRRLHSQLLANSEQPIS